MSKAPGLTNLGAEVVWGTWAKIARLLNLDQIFHKPSVSGYPSLKGVWGRRQSWSLQTLLYKPHRTRNRSSVKGLGVTVSVFWVSRPWFLQYRSLPSSKTSMATPVTNTMWGRTGENGFLLPSKLTLLCRVKSQVLGSHPQSLSLKHAEVCRASSQNFSRDTPSL